MNDPLLAVLLEGAINIYLLLTFITALGMTLFIPARAPLSIRTDLTMTRVAFAIGIFLTVIAKTAETAALYDPLQQPLLWWFSICNSLIGSTLIVSLLFLYQVRSDIIVAGYEASIILIYYTQNNCTTRCMQS